MLVRGPIVSEGAWVSDPELNSCKEITYMGIRNDEVGELDLGTGTLDCDGGDIMHTLLDTIHGQHPQRTIIYTH
jgi:hypothetical protein